MWLVIVLASAGFLIFYAYNRISFYLKFTKNVNVEVNYLSKLEFPAVTFCNQNTYKLVYKKLSWGLLIQLTTVEPYTC